MKHANRSQLPRWTILYLVSLLLLVSSPIFGWGDSKEGKTDPTEPIWLDNEKTVEMIEAGTGWSRIRVFEAGDTSYAYGAEYLVITRAGVDDVPLSEADRLDLSEDFPPLSNNEEWGTETVTAFPPLDFIIVSPSNLDATSHARGFCNWSGSTYERTFDLDRNASTTPWNYSSGPFTGSFDADLPITGTADVNVHFEVKRCLGLPVKWRMQKVDILGDAAISGTANLQGSVHYSWDIERSHRILRTKLGEVRIYGIPIKFYLEGYIGFSAEAQVTASLGVTANLDGSGTFEIRCTRENGCSNSSNFASTSSSQITAGLEADAEVRAWGKVGVRAAVISDNIAYAQVAVRGWAGGDIWGYFGNNCGDADGDGTNETVRALAADTRAGYEVDLEIDSFISSAHSTTIYESERHLNWYDLLGDTTAFEPMVLGPAHLEPGETASFTARMRPCYPYDRAVTIEWPAGFSGATTLTNPRTSIASATGSFATGPTASFDVTARSDAEGRDLSATYSRTIIVADREDPPVIDAHPTSTTIPEGSTATLTVQASGDGPLSYRWQKGDVDLVESSRFSGTDTATLTITDVGLDTNGFYRVVVTNAYGTATSNAAFLGLTPECSVTLLNGTSSVGTPPVVRWETDCEEDGNTDVVLRSSSMGVTDPECIVDKAIWHAALSGEHEASYMVGGYHGGCPAVTQAKFWVEMSDRRDQRVIGSSSPIWVNFTPPSQSCSIQSVSLVDNGPGAVPTVQWLTDCPENDPLVRVLVKTSTRSELPEGCEKEAENLGFAFPWGSRDADYMAGGYGNACPPVGHSWFWVEIRESGLLTQRTDYLDAYYQP